MSRPRLKVISHEFSYEDNDGNIPSPGHPILLVQTDRGEIRIDIEDTKFLFYGFPYVHVGEEMGKTVTIPDNIHFKGITLDGYTDDPDIVRLAGEFRDALRFGTYPKPFVE